MKKIIGIVICMLLICTVLPVTGAIMFEKNVRPTLNDGTLSGYVNDTSMNPIEGALVQVYFHGTYEEDYTDSSGYYHITNIPICYCMKNCTASKSGYKSECVLLSIVENTTYDFVLASGGILYVGGSGPGNYSKIQDAVDDAINGDTVFVYDDSSPYYENLIVDKSISLIGEDKHMTVIDGNENKEGDADIIHIKAEGVIVQGFTIQNGSLDGGHQMNHHCGIEIRSDYNIIKNNIITDNYFGIQIGSITPTHRRNFSNHNMIKGNIIINNEKAGIHLMFGSYNNITENNISLNPQGIVFYYDGCNNLVTLNYISLNKEGIFMAQEIKTTIQRNTVVDNDLGINIWYSKKCKVIENNIFNNGKDAKINSDTTLLLRFWWSNTWEGNYWGEPLQQRKLIPGTCDFTFVNILFINLLSFDLEQAISFPFVNVDWNPAQEPYNIGV